MAEFSVGFSVSGHDLVRQVHDVLSNGVGPLRLTDHVKQALAPMAGLVVRRLVPVAYLLEEDFLEEAGILARTSLEVAISAAYIWYGPPAEREARARRFFAHEVIQLSPITRNRVNLNSLAGPCPSERRVCPAAALIPRQKFLNSGIIEEKGGDVSPIR